MRRGRAALAAAVGTVSLSWLPACGNDHQQVDPLTQRLAEKCGIHGADIHYAGQTTGYGTSETQEWWADDASSDHPALTLTRKLMPPGEWWLSCSGGPSMRVTVSDAELRAAAR